MDALRFITCGSVDDGKSTLLGRLLFETKLVFEDHLEALAADSKKFGTQGEKLDFALLLDGLQAERERGITMDVAYRFFATPKRRFIVADTPGHEQYTRNMAAGASTAEAAVLLVDARKGVLSQTQRHSRIVAMLGVEHVAVAINKMDLVDGIIPLTQGVLMKLIPKLLDSPMPLRNIIRAGIKAWGIGSFKFRLSIGAVDRPHYAYLVYHAADLGRKLGHRRISIIEYGVAGGNGLYVLEQHAHAVEKLLGIEIEIYGFDSGEGLPQPKDYRDLPYHWKAGFFRMDANRLNARLQQAKLVIGNIRDSAATFFEQHRPAPIGAIIHDFDLYSSTVEGLKMLDAGDAYYLPRIYCYFDDTIGSETELYNDYTGERLAIGEFNRSHDSIKLCSPYHLLSRRPETWHHQIWIGHFFNHPDYGTFISKEDQQLHLRG